MNRVAPFLLLAVLATPAVHAQTQDALSRTSGNSNITFAGPPGSPGMVTAVQDAFPNSQVSSVNSLPARSPAEAALIGRATPTPIENMPADGSVGAPGQPQVATPAEPVFPDSPAEIAARRTALWEAGAASQHLRQKGLTMGQGDRYFGSIAASTVEQDRVVLSRWKAWLPQFGVDPAKIEDEARRLPRAAFDAWASRFVWFACSPQAQAPQPAGCANLVE